MNDNNVEKEVIVLHRGRYMYNNSHSHWYTRGVKEVIHIRLHPNNINRDSEIEIPEAWMPVIKKHNRRIQKWTAEGATSRRNSEDQNAPITADHRGINGAA